MRHSVQLSVPTQRRVTHSSCTGSWGTKKDSFFYNKLAQGLAKAVSPCYFRYGGTGEDYTAYDFSAASPPEKNDYTMNATVFNGLVDFADAVGWDLIYGANAATHRYRNNTWDPSQFESLLTWVCVPYQLPTPWLCSEILQCPKDPFTLSPTSYCACLPP